MSRVQSNARSCLLVLALGCSGSVDSGPHAGGDEVPADAAADTDLGADTDARPPQGVDPGAVTLGEDSAAAISLTGIHGGASAGALIVHVVSGPQHGALDGTTGPAPLVVAYTPTANYFGSDSFAFTVTDADGLASAPVSVAITVENTADPPVASDDQAMMDEGATLVLDVLANDTDVDGDALEILSLADAVGCSVDTDGALVTVTGEANVSGTASFSYTIADGNGGFDSAAVTLTVVAVNDAPVGTPVAQVVLAEDTSATIRLTGTDAEDNETSLSVRVASGPTRGTLDASQGAVPFDVVYTPAQDANGSDALTFAVTDLDGLESTLVTVSILVTAVNDPPSAAADAVHVAMDTPKSIAVLANDQDVDGDVSSIASVTQPAHGTVTHDGAKVTYSPTTSYLGDDSFTYTMSAGGESDSATVSVVVVAAGFAGLAGSGSSSSGGLSNSAAHSSAPALAVDALGNPVVAWVELLGDSEIYVKRWNASAGAWAELGTGSASGGGISDNTGSSFEPAIAVGPAGEVVVAWTDTTFGSSNHVLVRAWDGSAWVDSPYTALGTGLSLSETASIACDATPGGTCWIAYNADWSGDDEIYVRQWNHSQRQWNSIGSITQAGGISNNSGPSRHAQISLGTAPMVMWNDSSAGGSALPNLRKYEGGWKTLGTSSAIPVTGTYNDDCVHAQLGSSVLVAWSETNSGDDDITVRRWTGSAWTALGGTLPGGMTATGGACCPTILSSPTLEPILVWRDRSSGVGQAYVRKWNATAWEDFPSAGSSSGSGVTEAPTNIYGLRAAAARDGTLCIAWYELVSGQFEVMVRCKP